MAPCTLLKLAMEKTSAAWLRAARDVAAPAAVGTGVGTLGSMALTDNNTRGDVANGLLMGSGLTGLYGLGRLGHGVSEHRRLTNRAGAIEGELPGMQDRATLLQQNVISSREQAAQYHPEGDIVQADRARADAHKGRHEMPKYPPEASGRLSHLDDFVLGRMHPQRRAGDKNLADLMAVTSQRLHESGVQGEKRWGDRLNKHTSDMNQRIAEHGDALQQLKDSDKAARLGVGSSIVGQSALGFAGTATGDQSGAQGPLPSSSKDDKPSPETKPMADPTAPALPGADRFGIGALLDRGTTAVKGFGGDALAAGKDLAHRAGTTMQNAGEGITALTSSEKPAGVPTSPPSPESKPPGVGATTPEKPPVKPGGAAEKPPVKPGGAAEKPPFFSREAWKQQGWTPGTTAAVAGVGVATGLLAYLLMKKRKEI